MNLLYNELEIILIIEYFQIQDLDRKFKEGGEV